MMKNNLGQFNEALIKCEENLTFPEHGLWVMDYQEPDVHHSIRRQETNTIAIQRTKG